MTKIAARVLLVTLGVALMGSPVLAHASSSQDAPQTQSSKKTRKSYLKHQKKQEKKFKKDAKKAQKQIKKQHEA